ncbi:unnamed protein product [Phytophthora lilii]|uniref:Unnamed protein product n=1 Tax=Phytophthora lilii TaxID=2077276 RepID=A0A9W6U0V0_9STRA|nr:unnamed protein product [Phytophthora lilii]
MAFPKTNDVEAALGRGAESGGGALDAHAQTAAEAAEGAGRAITLREHVATFFPEDDGGQRGHHQFLELLKSWLKKKNTLQQVEVESPEAEIEEKMFENYYDVLEVDEDYFPEQEVVGSGMPRRKMEDRERMFHEAFAEDLRLEVVYFFLELEELVEGLAMDTASELTARLQTQYPALKRADDVGVILMDNLSGHFWSQVVVAIAEFWESFEKERAYKFVPGMLVVDLEVC